MKNEWEIEQIPDDSNLFRFVHINMIDKNKRIPSESNFSKREEDEGLSVDWEEYTTPEKTLARISKTYKYGKTEFKDYKDYIIFKLNTGFVRKIPDVREITHDPLFNGNPAPKGNPNNRAHSLIIYDYHNDPEVRLKLRDHAKQVETNDEQVDLHLENWGKS